MESIQFDNDRIKYEDFEMQLGDLMIKNSNVIILNETAILVKIALQYDVVDKMVMYNLIKKDYLDTFMLNSDISYVDGILEYSATDRSVYESAVKIFESVILEKSDNMTLKKVSN